MGIIDSNGVMPCRHPKHEWEHGEYTFENKRIFNLSKKFNLAINLTKNLMLLDYYLKLKIII